MARIVGQTRSYTVLHPRKEQGTASASKSPDAAQAPYSGAARRGGTAHGPKARITRAVRAGVMMSGLLSQLPVASAFASCRGPTPQQASFSHADTIKSDD